MGIAGNYRFDFRVKLIDITEIQEYFLPIASSKKCRFIPLCVYILNNKIFGFSHEEDKLRGLRIELFQGIYDNKIIYFSKENFPANQPRKHLLYQYDRFSGTFKIMNDTFNVFNGKSQVNAKEMAEIVGKINHEVKKSN